MKRRIFLSAVVASPVVPSLLGQAPVAPAVVDPFAGFKFATADDAADTVLHFFDARQFATLRQLCDTLIPHMGTWPNASDARVPEFFDFLLSEAPTARQQLWQSGLDTLEYDAQATFRKAFAQCTRSETDQLLAGLRQPWTYTPPTPLVEFLRAAKAEVRTAWSNSREYAQSTGSAQSGQFWKAVE
jgi:hypothetical protein